MWKIFLSSASLFTRQELNGLSLLKQPIVSVSNTFILSRSLTTKEEILKTSLKQPIVKKETPNTNTSGSDPKSPKEKYAGLKKLLGVFVAGAVSYFAVSFVLDATKVKFDGINYSSKNLPGKIKPSKKIVREKNPGNIKITLYQYATCPFCCKVKAYLDYYGYSYDIVEVNSITKSQLDWSNYKKVPQVCIQLPSTTNPEEYDDENMMQLNDSSVIVSALETFRLDISTKLRDIARYYEPVQIDFGKNDKVANDYINRYFVMLHSEKVNDGKSLNERKEEREWRGWVDAKFIHVISPNVYRTFGEALDTFNWFNIVGEWDKNFNAFERLSTIYIGTIVMYLLSIHLKKKHNLKDDVRQSLYDYCNEWVSSIDGRQVFRGGPKPNLSDLSLYGAIQSFEGCDAFNDMINNSKIKNWYEAMKEQVEQSKGSVLLNNPFYSVKHSMDNCNDKEIKQKKKATKRFYIF